MIILLNLFAPFVDFSIEALSAPWYIQSRTLTGAPLVPKSMQLQVTQCKWVDGLLTDFPKAKLQTNAH
jgi:hypothetical protein